MPPTLAAVAALPQLGLRALTEVRTDLPVRWVAVSELEDPTPFLEGGELVLTTGMRLSPDNVVPYVSRLVERGVAGLGFAVGVIHPVTLPDLVDAARDQGLTLLEVPQPVPFIAIGKAVSRLLAAEWYEDDTRAFQAQRELTRAALRGPGPLVARLARELDGWTMLLDPSGEVRHASDLARARRRAAELAPDLARLARETRTASITLSDKDDHVVVQGVGVSGRPRAFLAVGTAERLPRVAHTIVGSAVALLTLQSESPRTTRDLRSALAGLLLGLPPGGPAFPASPVRVLACAGGAAVLDALGDDDQCLPVPLPDGTIAVIVPAGAAERLMALAHQSGPVGASDPAGLDSLGHALRQARQALAAARRHRAALRYSDLPGQGLLGILDPALAQGFAETLLAPLGADETLVASLRAYIAANGQGETAARALGVHRHTLRARIQKAARLLGRDLDEPAVRAELWIALAVTANGAGPIGHPGH
ncbi:PucR family transcriptional regulator [Actinomadura rudentiformis]|uniref:PucR family transcriptional regulator n=1 Tax=Actinomadura rudentiformis TaxID=359158 RepID=A0A6H9YZP6_9ACTN|nr:PucR family transcriptional regulator [Actinomadura rudentiformis]KAB2347493.1 PucR family transcriptional regulator [Actinomadura rudentiformis]